MEKDIDSIDYKFRQAAVSRAAIQTSLEEKIAAEKLARELAIEDLLNKIDKLQLEIDNLNKNKSN